MNFQVEYTPNAQSELESVYLWIKARAPISAVRWRDDLIAKVESLASDPGRHRLAPESRRFPVDIAISKTDFRITEQKVLYKTGGSALRMVVESARTQT